jgi:hypothetical protein
MTSIFVRRAVGALAIVSCSLLTSSAVAHADDDDITVLPPIVVTASPDEGGGGGPIGIGGIGLPGGGGGGAGQPPQQIEPIVVTATPMTAAEKAELNAAVKNESWQGAIAVLTSRGFTRLATLGGTSESGCVAATSRSVDEHHADVRTIGMQRVRHLAAMLGSVRNARFPAGDLAFLAPSEVSFVSGSVRLSACDAGSGGLDFFDHRSIRAASSPNTALL